MTTRYQISQISQLEISPSKMGQVNLLWRMFINYVYKLQVMKIPLSSSQCYCIIAPGVI